MLFENADRGMDDLMDERADHLDAVREDGVDKYLAELPVAALERPALADHAALLAEAAAAREADANADVIRLRRSFAAAEDIPRSP